MNVTQKHNGTWDRPVDTPGRWDPSCQSWLRRLSARPRPMKRTLISRGGFYYTDGNDKASPALNYNVKAGTVKPGQEPSPKAHQQPGRGPPPCSGGWRGGGPSGGSAPSPVPDPTQTLRCSLSAVSAWRPEPPACQGRGGLLQVSCVPCPAAVDGRSGRLCPADRSLGLISASWFLGLRHQRLCVPGPLSTWDSNSCPWGCGAWSVRGRTGRGQ